MYEKLSDAAAEAVVFALVADWATEHKDAARAWLLKHMGPDAAAVKAVANGQDVGRATWVEGKPKPVIIDNWAFFKFVEEHYPDEIVSSVNPAFQKAILTNSTVVDGTLIDRNGLPVPGVEFRIPNPYVAVKKADSARELVETLLDRGQLRLNGITQLEGPQ